MKEAELNLTKRPTDKLIYIPSHEIPAIPLDLLEFLQEQIPSRFPNLLEDPKEALIHYQGKLDLIAELQFIYDKQQQPWDEEDEAKNYKLC